MKSIKEKLKAIDGRDILIRALKTFFQTFLAYFTADEILSFTDYGDIGRFLITAGVSALAAAVSVIWNTLIPVMTDRGGEHLGSV